MDASLAFALELEERDEAVAERLEVLAGLSALIADVRARSELAITFLEGLPEARARLQGALAEAARELAETREALELAQASTARARGADATATARRHEAHAASDVRTGEEHYERLLARQSSLEEDAVAAGGADAQLRVSAIRISAELESAPRVAPPEPPGPGLAGLHEWAARAGAAVLVARSGLDTERERIVREANELAASVLGEQLSATSVAAIRRRLEGREG